VPKPVIARVQGYAIGGGNVMAVLCDMTIASDKAVFGQVGPKVGSVDPGWGTAYLAQVVGEKKAREIWYMCRRYSARRRWRWGCATWSCRTTSSTPRSPSGAARSSRRARPHLAIAKRSFNAATEHIRGIGSLGMQALSLYYNTAESKEGVRAFLEKRKPDFRKFGAGKA
jgi:2-ketocyclohexanecarboxyl-CoA hydrolase